VWDLKGLELNWWLFLGFKYVKFGEKVQNVQNCNQKIATTIESSNWLIWKYCKPNTTRGSLELKDRINMWISNDVWKTEEQPTSYMLSFRAMVEPWDAQLVGSRWSNRVKTLEEKWKFVIGICN